MCYVIKSNQLHMNNFLELEVSSGFQVSSRYENRESFDTFEMIANVLDDKVHYIKKNKTVKLVNRKFAINNENDNILKIIRIE